MTINKVSYLSVRNQQSLIKVKITIYSTKRKCNSNIYGDGYDFHLTLSYEVRDKETDLIDIYY